MDASDEPRSFFYQGPPLMYSTHPGRNGAGPTAPQAEEVTPDVLIDRPDKDRDEPPAQDNAR
jgi:hypothetical protein